MRSQKPKYPFSYFGHGSAYSSKALGLFIIFKNNPNALIKKKILKELPIPLSRKVKWTRNVLAASSSEAYEGEVKRFIKRINSSDDYWLEFEELLESQFIKINKIAPILTIYKPSGNKYSFNYSKWHKWSVTEYDKYLFPKIYENYQRSEETGYGEYLLTIINGYFHEQNPNGRKLSKSVINSHIKMIDDYFIENAERLSKNSSSVYFTNTLSKLLGLFDAKNRDKAFEDLSFIAKLLIYKQDPGKLFSSLKTVDLPKLKKLLEDSAGSKNRIFSDLLGNILSESGKLNKTNKTELLEFLSEYLIDNSVTDILAVNLLYELINSKGKDRILPDKIFNRIAVAVINDKKLLSDKHVRNNLGLYYSMNKGTIKIADKMKKGLQQLLC